MWPTLAPGAAEAGARSWPVSRGRLPVRRYSRGDDVIPAALSRDDSESLVRSSCRKVRSPRRGHRPSSCFVQLAPRPAPREKVSTTGSPWDGDARRPRRVRIRRPGDRGAGAWRGPDSPRPPAPRPAASYPAEPEYAGGYPYAPETPCPDGSDYPDGPEYLPEYVPEYVTEPAYPYVPEPAHPDEADSLVPYAPRAVPIRAGLRVPASAYPSGPGLRVPDERRTGRLRVRPTVRTSPPWCTRTSRPRLTRPRTRPGRAPRAPPVRGGPTRTSQTAPTRTRRAHTRRASARPRTARPLSAGAARPYRTGLSVRAGRGALLLAARVSARAVFTRARNDRAPARAAGPAAGDARGGLEGDAPGRDAPLTVDTGPPVTGRFQPIAARTPRVTAGRPRITAA